MFVYYAQEIYNAYVCLSEICMNNYAVLGLQWGDEGKGKIIDFIADKFDAVVRYQGGSNAGHTLVLEGKTHKLSVLPSGVLHNNTTLVIGNEVAFNPELF